MKILVANLGSTSFKYRLFDMATKTQQAKGGIDRIGQQESQCVVEIDAIRSESKQQIPNHAVAVEKCLEQLTDKDHGCLASVSEVSAIGFKAVFAGKLSGVRRVDEELLTKMEQLADIAPAHNPPYARAMRELKSAFPNIPLVAALETGFHESIPEANRLYAVPYEWKENHEVQRWGFHGASHRYIATRTAELLNRDDLKIISCHLGGSSSICGIEKGKSIVTSMGMSPQSGLPHNNRVGDFDPFALPVLMKATGKTLGELLNVLATQSGLLGVSGLSGDVRDLEQAAEQGNKRAQLALDVFTASIRQYIGAYLAMLGGADAIVFTGGIGENSRQIRQEATKTLGFAGIQLDADKNQNVSGETRISMNHSAAEVWVIPTNEELIVARQTQELINQHN